MQSKKIGDELIRKGVANAVLKGIGDYFIRRPLAPSRSLSRYPSFHRTLLQLVKIVASFVEILNFRSHFPLPESLPLVEQQFLQFRRSEAIKLNQTELFKHYAGNLVAAFIEEGLFLDSLAITKMVTMTSESDKASSSVSKKTNAPTVVAPITEVAPNILVYKKVRRLLPLARNVIDFCVALDRGRWSKSLSGCRARAAAWWCAQ